MPYRNPFPEGTFEPYCRMILFKVPPVIPTQVLWLVMLFAVGILGLIGQVCYPCWYSDHLMWPIFGLWRLFWQWVFNAKQLGVALSQFIPRYVSVLTLVYLSHLWLLRQIVFAVMFEFLFSRTTPSALSIVGTLIIVTSAIYITVILPLSLPTVLYLYPCSWQRRRSRNLILPLRSRCQTMITIRKHELEELPRLIWFAIAKTGECLSVNQ